MSSELSIKTKTIWLIVVGIILITLAVLVYLYQIGNLKISASESGFTQKSLDWECGNRLVDERDNQKYDTVQIGDQCWMRQNINVGTRIDGVEEQTDNGEIEKYCYNDNENICDTEANPNYSDGGLYQWQEAIQYADFCNGTGEPPNDACTNPIQGICPNGWHLPSFYEFITLIKNVSDNPEDFIYDQSTTDWLGTNEGINLKSGGNSEFEVNMTGYRDGNNGSFGGREGNSALTSISSSSGRDQAAGSYGLMGFRMALQNNIDNVLLNYARKEYGYSVRCIKDTESSNSDDDIDGDGIPNEEDSTPEGGDSSSSGGSSNSGSNSSDSSGIASVPKLVSTGASLWFNILIAIALIVGIGYFMFRKEIFHKE
jgi:uncharacterized protein (TIGR02145 family)